MSTAIHDREIRRVRHESKPKHLIITQTQALTPRMLRITFAGPDLDGFSSPGFDDHVKLIFPGESEPGGRPPMRDYTPRFDAAARELHIEFALHDGGLASEWAVAARVGDRLVIGGPRGSVIIPTNFDWYLLVGDETALPAVGRRLEELPRGSRALLFIEVDNEQERQSFTSQADVAVHWVYRHGAPAGTSERLINALRATQLPGGDYFAWAAAETSVARSLRRILLEDKGARREWTKAAGYWRRGAVGAHDKIED